MNVLDNPTLFTNPFQFQITCECLAPGVQEELEWKLIYVGSAEDDKCDQTLDSILVGPVPIGTSKFVFQAPAPELAKIPEADLLDVTAILLIGLYKDREFIRIGYYVNNDYGSNAELNETPPSPPLLHLIHRNILADKARVTRFDISWDDCQHEEKLQAEKDLQDLQETGVCDTLIMTCANPYMYCLLVNPKAIYKEDPDDVVGMDDTMENDSEESDDDDQVHGDDEAEESNEDNDANSDAMNVGSDAMDGQPSDQISSDTFGH